MSIYKVLEELDIDYEKHEHPAVFTVEEAQKHDRGIDAGKTKNLFLRNKKGDKHYLLVVESTKKADLKKLARDLKENNLGFASPERLHKHLGLTPGSVSPFGLINDTKNHVHVLIDRELLTFKKLGFHPNINTATLAIRTEKFIKFLDWTGNLVSFIDLF
jgi:Ala-tRNA(Pro) deacylase